MNENPLQILAKLYLSQPIDTISLVGCNFRYRTSALDSGTEFYTGLDEIDLEAYDSD